MKNRIKNESAVALGKLSAKARSKIHDSEYYKGLAKKSVKARKLKAKMKKKLSTV